MRIVLIGQNPYLVTSYGKLHSWIAKHLYSQGNEVAIIAHTYDTNYFVPEETDDGKVIFCYKFNDGTDNKIPLFPYKKGANSGYETEAVFIYELLEKLSPDLVISIDDFESAVFMQAVKMFLPDKFKWMWVLLNGSLPINEQSISAVESADAILCTNRFTYENINSFYAHPCMDWKYVGTDHSKYFYKNIPKDGIRIISTGKNCLKDYIPCTMKVCSDLNVSLYLHLNQLDGGFYSLDILRKRYDSESISFPENHFSVKDACSDEEMNDLFNENNVFMSSSILSSCSMSLFDAMAAGCIPLINPQGSDIEIIKSIKELEVESDYLICDAVDFMTTGEKILKIPIEKSMKDKILKINNIFSDRQNYERVLDKILRISKRYSCLDFMKKVDEMVREITKNKQSVFSLT
jgi:hypothetical protein